MTVIFPYIGFIKIPNHYFAVMANLSTSPDGLMRNVTFDRAPNLCPHCHHKVSETVLKSILIFDELNVIFQCTNELCQQVYIGYYTKPPVFGDQWRLGRISMGKIIRRNFEPEVNLISPLFSEIYNQSAVAEEHSLIHIAGMGYRKAIEFLVKDYAIRKFPDKEEEIKAKLLGKVIDDYVDFPKLKNMVQRAVWLGNDETHYTRKWEDKNIDDLKNLIDITIHWIMIEITTDRYESEMPR